MDSVLKFEMILFKQSAIIHYNWRQGRCKNLFFFGQPGQFQILLMQRERITVTLNKKIIEEVDKTVDGVKIRNRSHAIEYILTDSFLPKNTKVLILAGGEGVKLRPLTYEVPKALLTIHNKPLLAYTLENFAKNNLRDIIISVGYLGGKIKNYFGDGGSVGLRISYIEQKERESGTAQPLLQAKEMMGNNPFVLYYGDVLADIDILDMLKFHESHKETVTMALTTLKEPTSWGVANMKGIKIVDFIERPEARAGMSHLINAGIYVMETKIFDYLSPSTKKIETDVFPPLSGNGELFGYSFQGQWFDVGTMKNYETAVKEWKIKK